VNEIVKRLFDLVASAAGLAILAPLMIVCFLLVRLSSTGAAIFVQTRVGEHGELFTLYKFRTMHTGTLVAPTHVVGSNTITLVGGILRKYKLDELPQLVNVLKGDMSLVGPRPCLPTQIELIEARRREGVLGLKPGVTGLAQVQGIDMSDPEKLAAVDGSYARNRTFLNDVWLILQTVGGRGVGVDPARRSSAMPDE
jgi:O-antigen biosynthesis protein WbqP